MPQSILAEYILLAALWGSSFLFMRLGAHEFGVLATAGMRVGIASLVLLPLVVWRGQWPDLRRHAGRILVIGVFNSAIPFALFAYAVTSISTGLSGILNATVPLFGAIVAWLWLRERPDASRVLGLAIGFAGVVLLAKDQASFKPGGTGWAVLACLGATLCYALSASATKRYLTGVPSLATAAGSQIGAALALAVPTAVFWPAQLPGPTAWLSVLALGVFCSALAYILYFRLLSALGPSRGVTVTFLVPVFALLYGSLFLGERLTAQMLGFGAIVVCGTALSTGVLRLPFGRRPKVT